MSDNLQCTCLTFFNFKGFRPKIKGFELMQKGHSLLAESKGLTFYKLLGTGRGNGFNPYPDFSTYALITIWESRNLAKSFLLTSNLMNVYTKIAVSTDYFLMNCIKSNGFWGGVNPFISVDKMDDTSQIAVLTRAKIKVSKLFSFWKYVPASSRPLKTNKDLLFTKGIGEIPVLNMATFSVWKNLEAMKNFAYQSQEHIKAMRKTRELKWYSEELFVRFVILEKGKI